MGIFDWGNSDDELLVTERIAQDSESETVTKKNLTTGLSKDESVLSYLKDGEQPQFILHNRTKGLTYNERGQKDTIKPSDNNRAFAVFTDQRVLFLVGCEGRTGQRNIQYDDIESIEASTGVLKHRIDLKTLYANYRFYVSNSINSGEFNAAITFLRRQADFEKVESESISNSPTSTNGKDSIAFGERDQQNVLQHLRGLDPYDFEHFVADLWEAQGWNTTVSQASVDQGVDIVATKEDPFPQKQVIQAKRYASSNTIGSPKIQQYASLRQQEEGADASVIVTTSSFSNQAEDTAQNLNVKLVDAESIYGLLNETGRFDLISKYSPVFTESDEESAEGEKQITRQGGINSTSRASEAESSSATDMKPDDESALKEYKDCPSCGQFTAMKHAWRKDLILPVLQCTQCQTLHHETNDEITPLSRYMSERDNDASKYGYYGIFSSLTLALLSLGVPILGLISWVLLPVGISRDTRYVRSNSDRNPATGYWVWGAILASVVGVFALGIVGVALSLLAVGGAYLVQRYRADSTESGLHRGRIASFITEKRGG